MSAKIIHLEGHPQRFTASDLVEEFKEHMGGSGRVGDFDSFIEDMPEVLTSIADHIMSDIDYRRIKSSNLAMGLRCLVGLAVTFEGYRDRCVNGE